MHIECNAIVEKHRAHPSPGIQRLYTRHSWLSGLSTELLRLGMHKHKHMHAASLALCLTLLFPHFLESVLRLFIIGHHNSSRLRAVHRWTIHTWYRTYVIYSCLELTCFHHFLVAFYARLCVPQLLLCLISPLCQLTRSGEPALSQKVNALPCATSKKNIALIIKNRKV